MGGVILPIMWSVEAVVVDSSVHGGITGEIYAIEGAEFVCAHEGKNNIRNK